MRSRKSASSAILWETGGEIFPSLGAEFIQDLGSGFELEAYSFGYFPVEKQSARAVGLRGSRRFAFSDHASMFFGPAYERRARSRRGNRNTREHRPPYAAGFERRISEFEEKICLPLTRLRLSRSSRSTFRSARAPMWRMVSINRSTESRVRLRPRR
jgi:hypothetical protein